MNRHYSHLKAIAIAFLSMAFSTALLSHDTNSVSPLLIGSEVPDATVRDANGRNVQLSSILKDNNTIIIFYRGGWCPYCTRHMKEVAEIEPQLLEMGYQIIALSPDSPAKIREAKAALPGHYKLYSDATLEAADAFGIAFELQGKAAERMAPRLSDYSEGKNTNRLPTPSVFLTTPDGYVSFQYVDPNFRFRIPGDLLLAAAKASSDFHKK